LKTKLAELEQELSVLHTEAETSEEVPTIDTSEMEADIREAEEAVEEAKKRYAAVQEEIEAMQPAIEEQQNKLDEVNARNDKVVEDLEAAEAKVEDIVKVCHFMGFCKLVCIQSNLIHFPLLHRARTVAKRPLKSYARK
jgi:peptidoglycan hydrolase CwlO-like protein